MSVVTVTANQLVFANRMGRHLKGLGPNVLVAFIADFRLGGAFQYLAGLVHHMTINTGHIFGFMLAGKPVEHMAITLVAFQANAVLGFQGRRALAAKIDHANIVRILGMFAAWAVTGFTALRGI